MDAPGVRQERAPRLNPFAFPSDTDFRFVLLVAAVLGSTLLLYAAIYEALPPTREYKRTHTDACARVSDPTDFSGSYAERVARIVAYEQCTAAVDSVQAAWMVGGVAIVLVCAAALAWALPVWRLRRERLLPVVGAPEVTDALDELCREAALTSSPTFVWNPLNPLRTGLAFGRWRRHYVALTGGLVTQLFTDPPAFRAVVRHELAHLRNGDVARTYFTVALWRAFLVAALVPSALALLVSGRPLGDLVGVAWRVALLGVLVYATRNAVLRAREVYADVRASVWDGSDGALRRTIEALPPPRHGRWAGFWRLHPDPRVRRRAIDDTRPLLDVRPWDAWAAGIAAGVALPNVVILMQLVVPTPIAIAGPLTAALVCAPLAVGVVGLAVWRAAFAALARGARLRGAGRAGIALGIGIVLGQELSLAAVELAGGVGPVAGVPVVVLDLTWGALLVLVLALFFRWIAACASTWLEVTLDDPSPGRAYSIGLTIAGLLLTVWLGVLFFVYLAARTGGGAVGPSDFDAAQANAGATQLGELLGTQAMLQGATAILALLQLAALASLAIVCLYPLSAWLWRHRRARPTVAPWAYLDSVETASTLPLLPSLRPGAAASVGGAGGVLYCGVAFVWFSRADTDPSGSILVAIATQMLLGLAVAVWVPRLGVLHGLFAALVGGTIMAAGTLTLLAGLGLLEGDWQVPLLLWSTIVLGGACAAAPLAVVGAELGGRVRRAT